MDKASERASFMLRIAAIYIRKYCPDELYHYNEADCDGGCVADDCDAAAEELRNKHMEIYAHGSIMDARDLGTWKITEQQPPQNRDSVDLSSSHYCKQCHSIIGCDCRSKTSDKS